MELNHKYIHNYLLFMQLINLIHRSIDSHLALDFEVILSTFLRMLLLIIENRSWNNHFWIFACGGNEHQWTNVSLFAELWGPAKVLVEQEEKLYFSKIRGCGMFYALYTSVCNVDL